MGWNFCGFHIYTQKEGIVIGFPISDSVMMVNYGLYTHIMGRVNETLDILFGVCLEGAADDQETSKFKVLLCILTLHLINLWMSSHRIF